MLWVTRPSVGYPDTRAARGWHGPSTRDDAERSPPRNTRLLLILLGLGLLSTVTGCSVAPAPMAMALPVPSSMSRRAGTSMCPRRQRDAVRALTGAPVVSLPRGVDAAQGATCGVLLRSPLGTGVTAHPSYPESQA